MGLNFGQNLFPPRGEVLASYNYFDIAEGTGIIIFYAFTTFNSGTREWTFNQSSNIASRDIEVNVKNGTTTINASPFNLHKIIDGTAVINFSYEADNADARTITCTLYKKSGVTSTQIGTVTTGAFNPGNSIDERMCLTMDVTRTHFKKGDFFYLNLIDNIATAGLTIGFDPINQAGTLLTTPSKFPTQFKLLIPFDINI